MKEDLKIALEALSREELIAFIVGTTDVEGLNKLARSDMSDLFKKAFFIYGVLKLKEN